MDSSILIKLTDSATLYPGSRIGLGVPFEQLNISNPNSKFIFLQLCYPSDTENVSTESCVCKEKVAVAAPVTVSNEGENYIRISSNISGVDCATAEKSKELSTGDSIHGSEHADHIAATSLLHSLSQGNAVAHNVIIISDEEDNITPSTSTSKFSDESSNCPGKRKSLDDNSFNLPKKVRLSSVSNNTACNFNLDTKILPINRSQESVTLSCVSVNTHPVEDKSMVIQELKHLMKQSNLHIKQYQEQLALKEQEINRLRTMKEENSNQVDANNRDSADGDNNRMVMFIDPNALPLNDARFAEKNILGIKAESCSQLMESDNVLPSKVSIPGKNETSTCKNNERLLASSGTAQIGDLQIHELSNRNLRSDFSSSVASKLHSSTSYISPVLSDDVNNVSKDVPISLTNFATMIQNETDNKKTCSVMLERLSPRIFERHSSAFPVNQFPLSVRPNMSRSVVQSKARDTSDTYCCGDVSVSNDNSKSDRHVRDVSPAQSSDFLPRKSLELGNEQLTTLDSGVASDLKSKCSVVTTSNCSSSRTLNKLSKVSKYNPESKPETTSNKSVLDVFTGDFSFDADEDDLPDIALPSTCTSTPVSHHQNNVTHIGDPIPYNDSSMLISAKLPVDKNDSNSLPSSSGINTDSIKIEEDWDISRINECNSVLPAINIKQEKINIFEEPSVSCDSDADDVLMVYSQMDECIYLSSDEEHKISSQESSFHVSGEIFGPVPSPDFEIKQLFESSDEESESDPPPLHGNREKDSLLSAISVGNDHSESDLIGNECETRSSETISDDTTNTLPSVSEKPKHFMPNQPRQKNASSNGNGKNDFLSTHVIKSRSRPAERTSKFTSPIVPINKRTLHRKSSSGSSKSSTSNSRSAICTKSVKRSEGKSRRKSSPDRLRKSLAKTYNLKHNASLKSKDSSSNDDDNKLMLKKRNISVDNNNSTVDGAISRVGDHQYKFDLVREDENISFQKKSSAVEKSAPPIVAKITRKNRSQKLTEVNLFPSPEMQFKKSKVVHRGQKKIVANLGESTTITAAKEPIVGMKDVTSNITPLPNGIEAPINSDNLLLNVQTVASTWKQSKLLSPNLSSAEIENSAKLLNIEQPLERKKIEKSNIIPDYVRLPGGILKRGMEKSTRGHITFASRIEDLEKVRLISPRKDKDKTGPNTVNYRELSHRACPKINFTDNVHKFYRNSNYFIFKVCSWNYDWLKQYHVNQLRSTNVKPPPLFAGNKDLVFPTQVLYESFKDYHEVFSILLFYEVWENIYRDWLKFKETIVWFKCEVDVVRTHHESIGRTGDAEGYNFTLIKLVSLINPAQEKDGLHPRIGSLVAIKVPVDERSTIILAYVSDLLRQSRTIVSKTLKELIPHGTTTLALSVITSKGTAAKIAHGSLLNVCNVSYLKPSLRLWDGLVELPKNPLGPYVLKPHVECLSSPITVKKLIIPEFSLNSSQLRAVSSVSSAVLADGSPKISLIHGPPGTGKTLTLIALITQIFRCAKERNLRSRILVCAPSNAAVDELTRRLVTPSLGDIGFNVVRVGFAGRNCSDRLVQSRSWDILVEQKLEHFRSNPPDERSRQELERMTVMLAAARKEMMDETDSTRKQKCQDRVVALVKRRNQFERDCRQHLSPSQLAERRWVFQREVLLSADIITSTLGSCCNETVTKILKDEVSVCIVDEAGQCKETETWLPLMTGVRKLVLAGDHMQLPPTVLSLLAQGKNLKQSLFERIYYHITTEENKPALIHMWVS